MMRKLERLLMHGLEEGEVFMAHKCFMTLGIGKMISSNLFLAPKAANIEKHSAAYKKMLEQLYSELFDFFSLN
jgi:hypothetical protein